jgi:hypothetical protein
MFFFEKKNQKTFDASGVPAPDSKALLLFLQKKKESA